MLATTDVLHGIHLCSSDADAKPDFVLKKDDVVAFVGGSDMVRMQKEGLVETSITKRFLVANPRFRDLAWDGDAVYRQSTDL